MAKSTRVLVVDDDREIARGLSYRLKAKGYDVDIAHGGEQGLALAVECKPDAIVLDIRMPDIDGLTVLSRLKGDPITRAIPVIMCSASLIDQKDALDRGASFFVQKPYEASELIDAIQAASSPSVQPTGGGLT